MICHQILKSSNILIRPKAMKNENTFCLKDWMTEQKFCLPKSANSLKNKNRDYFEQKLS